MDIFIQMINYMRARQAVSIFCLILKKDFEEFMFYTKDGKLVTEMFTQGTPTDLIENVYNTYIIREDRNQNADVQKIYDARKESFDKYKQPHTNKTNIINYDTFIETNNN